MQGRVVIDYTNMVIDYQRATLPEITACNRLHYYGNRLPVVILARKQKQKAF